MAKTITEIAVSVLKELGRLPGGQVAPNDQIKIIKDAYSGLYEDLFENSLVSWAEADSVPEFAVWPIEQLLCARTAKKFGVDSAPYIALNDAMEGKLAELVSSPHENDITPGDFF